MLMVFRDLEGHKLLKNGLFMQLNLTGRHELDALRTKHMGSCADTSLRCAHISSTPIPNRFSFSNIQALTSSNTGMSCP